VLPGALAAATTEVDEDVDVRPPGKCCGVLRQWPSLELMKTSMAGPWEVLLGAPVVVTTEVDEDVDGMPPRRCMILSSIVVCSGFCKKDVGGNE
jgi:hypothetical protein